MKRVLQVINYGARYRGNFIESLEYLDGLLKKEDTQNIYLFCASAKTGPAHVWTDEMIAKGDTVYFLSGNMKEDVELIKGIVRDFEVVLVHTHFITMEQFRTVDKAVPKSIQVIMHMHNHSRQGNFVKNILRQIAYRRCIMVACSESVYGSLERDYPKLEKYYVDNGVNYDRLDTWSEIDPSDYKINGDEKKLLIFGFDFYRKGVDLAVKAVDSLVKKGGKYVLLISLSTNFEFVENEIKKILGEMPDWVRIIEARNDVASLYNMVDLFLSPSREEGLPYSVIEAEYCKCSIVLSDISAQNKLKLKYGYWFEDGNVEGFEKQIEKAISEREKKLSDMEAVKNHMRESYSLSEWGKKIIKIYEDTLRR